MQKKGMALTLETVVIAILVVLVLLVVVTFFLGGTAGITRTIREIFFGTTAGMDKNIAIETCKQRCDSAMALPSEEQTKSAYCKSPLGSVDWDGNGKADEDPEGSGKRKTFYCYPMTSPLSGMGSIGVPCSGIQCV